MDAPLDTSNPPPTQAIDSPPKSLRRRFAHVKLQTVLLIASLWLSLGVLTIWDMNVEIRSARAGAAALADALSAHTVRVMREAEQVAALVSWQVQNDGVSIPLAYYVSSGLLKLDVFVQVAVLDSQGYLRASTLTGFAPINLADREHFRIHVHNPSTALMIGRPVIGRASGKASLQLSQRISSLDGRFLGVVVVSVDPSYFTELYNGLRIGKNGVVAVVGTNDYIVRALRSGRDQAVGATVPPNDPFRRALAHARSGNLRTASFIDGRDTIISYRTLKDYPLAVAVGYSTSEYLAAWRARSLLLLAAAVALTILIVATERRTKTLLVTLAAANDREIAKAAQLEQARSDAESASRAKSAFLATMSHEIRTPMNGVIGMTEVLTRSSLSADQKEMACTIRDCASALLKIIDDILDFSKIEAGKLQIDCVPTSIEDIVDSLASSLATVADARGVALRTYVSPMLPASAMFDDTRLREILYNLVGNAIKFSAGRAGVQGHVVLRAMRIDGAVPEVRFEVGDNGIGMTTDTLAKLFQPFSQAEASTTRRFGGTGLGLAICRRLVALMGGRMAVQSEPGRGSTFTVELPLHPEDGADQRKPTDLSGLACIVVASPDWRCDDMADYLRHAGARVEIAADAYDAQQALSRAGGPRILVHDARCLADTIASGAPHGGTARQGGGEVLGDVLIEASRPLSMMTRTGNTVAIGAQALRRRVLVDAVALAAGRADSAMLAAADPGHDAVALTPADDGVMLLVAEDDEINRRVISRQLALLGYAADMAVDGEQALEMWRTKPYTLVLTDLHMPRRDGYELAQAIRADQAHERDAHTRVPIVALTANAITGEANRAKSLGIDDYLTKPLKLDQLAQALAQWTMSRRGSHAAGAGSVAPPAAAKGAPGSFGDDRRRHATAGAGMDVDVDVDETEDVDDSGNDNDNDNDYDAVEAIVDLNVLKDIVGDDMETVQALLVEYAQCSAELADQLRARLAEGRAHEAGAIAHKLKSSSRSIGALPLGDLCAEIEAAASKGETGGLERLGARFDVTYRRAIEVVRGLTLAADV
ncbi:ATP-binding protein [Trinickia dinghuensis]|uniref:Sensory/regulatory protein RpfC n=1 Tax=Trinickia dinghuensis TaxID=2291023 RepID=A0A3D8JUS3_9BURK|nr:ATP-binding protein [Trinickia dinghuensis]RDU96827.1 response regulator [Trinickia dinghuensis]